MTTAELLQKATLTTGDFGGAGEAPLSVEQVKQFIELMTAGQVMLPDVRLVTSNANKWEESVLDFAGRIAKPGTEATRLLDADRTKPATSNVTISTDLLRAEVPVSDEAFEDAAGDDLAGSLEALIADRFGYDVEELFINGDTGSGDAYLALLDGWVKLVTTSGNAVAAASYGQDYDAIFNRMIVAMPDRFKRNLESDGRFYVPQRLVEKLREQRAARGTALGDEMLQGKIPLKYQGIEIRGVPAMAITAGTPDTSNIVLTNRNNLYAGFRRRMTFESFRDPREGATSFIVTARVGAAVAVPTAAVVATSVDVEP